MREWNGTKGTQNRPALRETSNLSGALWGWSHWEAVSVPWIVTNSWELVLSGVDETQFLIKIFSLSPPPLPFLPSRVLLSGVTGWWPLLHGFKDGEAALVACVALSLIGAGHLYFNGGGQYLNTIIWWVPRKQWGYYMVLNPFRDQWYDPNQVSQHNNLVRNQFVITTLNPNTKSGNYLKTLNILFIFKNKFYKRAILTFLCFLYFDIVLLCSPGWSWTCNSPTSVFFFFKKDFIYLFYGY